MPIILSDGLKSVACPRRPVRRLDFAHQRINAADGHIFVLRGRQHVQRPRQNAGPDYPAVVAVAQEMGM